MSRLLRSGHIGSIMVTGGMLSRIVTTALQGCWRAEQCPGAGATTDQFRATGCQPSGWTFNIAPYGWFANVNVTSNLPLPPALGGTVTTRIVGRFRRFIVPPELRDDGCGGCAI